jgi:hypothetical protein
VLDVYNNEKLTIVFYDLKYDQIPALESNMFRVNKDGTIGAQNK